MIQPRLPHSRPTVALTSGDDEPRAACDQDYLPWDEMLAHAEGTKAHRAARAIAAMTCKGCDLRATCEFSLTRGVA